MDSILTSIKKMLGIQEDYEHFDTDIIVSINSMFSVLHQLRVGPETPFTIKDKTAVWSDFIADEKQIEMVKTYMYLNVRVIFDPPTNSSVLESYKAMAKEFEWRLNVACDPQK